MTDDPPGLDGQGVGSHDPEMSEPARVIHLTRDLHTTTAEIEQWDRIETNGYRVIIEDDADLATLARIAGQLDEKPVAR